MSRAPLTVPPPRADDHEDVAWALRAASAEWQRDAYKDAVVWIERAAETAEEVGAIQRSVELLQLAASLRRMSNTTTPPPPLIGGAPPPLVPPRAPSLPPPWSEAAPPMRPAYASAPVVESVEIEMELEDELDFIDAEEVSDVEAIEEVEADEHFFDDSEEDDPRPLPSFADLEDEDAPPPPTLPPTEERPSQRYDLPPLSVSERAAARVSRASSSPALPSNAFERGTDVAAPEFNESDLVTTPLSNPDFEDEAPTFIMDPSVSPIPSVPPKSQTSGIDIRIHSDHPFDFDQSSPAEVAMAQRAKVEDDDIEKELGVDLSLRAERHVGMASIRPFVGPGFAPTTSADSEPFAVAPSAELPPIAPIEPPSHPMQAPPQASMREPDLDLSEYDYPPDEDGPPGALRSGPPRALEMPPPSSQDTEPSPSGPGTKRSGRLRSVRPPGSVPPSGLEDALDLALFQVPGLEDLPEDVQIELLRKAKIVKLAPDEEVNNFAVAVVLRGTVQIMPTIADASSATVRKGGVIFTQGSLESGVDLRAVGFDLGTKVVVFGRKDFDEATASCPWVVDELKSVGDEFQGLAGAVMGPLGDSLDDMFRAMVLEKFRVKRIRAGQVIALSGRTMDGMYIVGAGKFELVASDGRHAGELGPGDFVFPETILSGSTAPHTVAALGDALVLYAERMAAHELLATCPPFIELLAGS